MVILTCIDTSCGNHFYTVSLSIFDIGGKFVLVYIAEHDYNIGLVIDSPVQSSVDRVFGAVGVCNNEFCKTCGFCSDLELFRNKLSIGKVHIVWNKSNYFTA